jgi:hypothetical protein
MNKDFVTGILFFCVGIFFQIYSRSYHLGTLSNMGPGYYPSLVSGLLTVIGLVLILKNIKK